MTFLVAGGSGFLGLNVIEELLSSSEQVISLDKSPIPPAAINVFSKLPGKFASNELDITNAEDVNRVISESDVDVVFYGAAITAGVEREISDPLSVFDVNVAGLLNVLEAACRLPSVKRIINISSGSAYGNGGFGVFHLPPDDDNLNALLEIFKERSKEPVMVQTFLSDVKKGDKRIILIDGKPAGAINRVPPKGDVRANMHAGGTPLKADLTKRDFEICEIIGPELKRRGLIFTGIDVIGGYLTEINVTSPTGLQEINRFDNVKLESQLWDAIEAKL